jgi:hypothetical protein
MSYVGGNGTDKGSGIKLYGGLHATQADDLELNAGVNTFLLWDESAGSFVVNTGTGAKTLAFTLDASQNATFTGAIQTTEASWNSSILQDRAWIWTADGLTGGTIRGGITVSTAGTLVLSTGAGFTTALSLTASQNATFAGTVDVSGVSIDVGGGTAAAPNVTINGGVTANPFLQFEQAGIAKAYIQWVHSATALLIDSDDDISFRPGNTERMTLDGATGVLGLTTGIRFVERADHPTAVPAATFGELWVKNTAPNKLYFTDDAGTDHDLTLGGGTIGGSITDNQIIILKAVPILLLTVQMTWR